MCDTLFRESKCTNSSCCLPEKYPLFLVFASENIHKPRGHKIYKKLYQKWTQNRSELAKNVQKIDLKSSKMSSWFMNILLVFWWPFPDAFLCIENGLSLLQFLFFLNPRNCFMKRNVKKLRGANFGSLCLDSFWSLAKYYWPLFSGDFFRKVHYLEFKMVRGIKNSL